MRRISRPVLDAETAAVLSERTQRILDMPEEERSAGATRLWESRVKAIDRVREILRDEMAPGPGRCMYCEGAEGHQIDHFHPRARRPEQTYAWENLLWSCEPCNNSKRDQFPLDDEGRPMLLDPTHDDPRDHLLLALRTGIYEGRTVPGKESVKVYALNRLLLPIDRNRVFQTLQILLTEFDARSQRGDLDGADVVQALIVRDPYASILYDMLRVAASPAAELVLDGGCLSALLRHRAAVAAWCEDW